MSADQPVPEPSDLPAPPPPTDEARAQLINNLRGAVNDASGEARGEYFTFMLFALYFLSTIGATTDEQLLRGGTVTMPLLGVGISIVGFYVVVPVLFVLAHLNMLIHLDSLAGKLNDLRAAAGRQWPAQQQLLRTFCRYPLAIFERDPVRWPIRVVAFCSVVLLPLVALLGAQIRFLPYHAVGVAWWQRALIVVDVVLILLFWQRIVPKALTTSTATRVAGGVARALPVAVVLLMAIATVPDETMERFLTYRPGWFAAAAATTESGPPTAAATCGFGQVHTYLSVVTNSARPAGGDEAGPRRMLCLTYLMFEQPETPLGMRRNLVVNHADLVTVRPPGEPAKDTASAAPAGQGPDEEALRQLWQDAGRGIDLSGRDLRFADLSGSDLRRADLRGANLRGAKLINADISYASLNDLATGEARCLTEFDPETQTCRTDLSAADLNGAKAKFSFFWKTLLENATLRGADLSHATLAHTSLEDADLSGADISNATVDSALPQVRLQGAKLSRANLRCASLPPAELEAAIAQGAVELGCQPPPAK